MKRYARGPARRRTWPRSSRPTLLARFPIGINALAIDPLPARPDRARSRSPAWWPARSRPAPGSARRSRGGSSTASASGACWSRWRSSTPPRWAASSALRRARRARRGARACCVPRRLRDPADVVGAALDVAEPAATAATLLQPAYALDSVLIELIFIARPAAHRDARDACVSPAAALIVSAASVITGTVLFTALPPSARVRARRRTPGGPLRRARLAGRAHAGARPRCPRASAIGMLRGRRCRRSPTPRAPRSSPAPLLALWSLGSAAGGLLYGALPRPAAARARAPRGRGLLPLGLLAAGGRAVGRGDGAARDPRAGCSSRRCSRRATS